MQARIELAVVVLREILEQVEGEGLGANPQRVCAHATKASDVKHALDGDSTFPAILCAELQVGQPVRLEVNCRRLRLHVPLRRELEQLGLIPEASADALVAHGCRDEVLHGVWSGSSDYRAMIAIIAPGTTTIAERTFAPLLRPSAPDS